LYETQRLLSMGAGALGGSLQGAASSGGNAIAMIFLVPIGLVGGTIYGAVAPATASVQPTTQQIQESQAVFKKVLEASFIEYNELGSALISEGNVRSGRVFTSFQQDHVAELQGSTKNQSSGKVTNAILQVANLSVLLIGSEAKDPRLRLRVSLKLVLTNDGSPMQCLGWYAGTWEGRGRHLAAWEENEGQALKSELKSAFDELSKKGIAYLFVPRYESFHVAGNKRTDQPLSECLGEHPEHPLADMEPYCPLADGGIAEYQREVGDFFYDQTIVSRGNFIRAYVWYGLAAKGNDEVAAGRLVILSQMLTPDEIKEARKKLADWKPGQCMNDLSDALANRP
jgi:hypothetical protein